MKSKINFLVLVFLCCPLMLTGQTNELRGDWMFLKLKENAEDISFSERSPEHYLSFAADGKFVSSIACNSIGGKYLSAKGKIKFNSFRMTAKACSGEESKLERSLSLILRKITRYQLKGGVLILQDERGMNAVTLTKQAPPE